MLKKMLAGVLAMFMLVGMAACGNKNNEISQQQAQVSSIKDSQGRDIKIPDKIEKAIVLNSNCYTMIEALGAKNTVVGVSDTVKPAIAAGVEEYGTWKEPNVEKIIAAKPDVVFGYGKYMKEESAKLIENSGITLVFLEFYMAKDVEKEMTSLGQLYKKETGAKKYTDFIKKYRDLLSDRLKDVKEEDKVKVYWESYTDYSTVSKGTGGNELIELAGCINIAASESTEYPKISDEWVLEKNPQMIIKNVSNTKNILGPDIKDSAKAKELYDNLKARIGWNNIDAIKNNKTIAIASEIGTSPDGSIIGTLVMAKTAYPDKFKGIDPIEIYKEMQSTFFGNSNTNGIMVYPWGA